MKTPKPVKVLSLFDGIGTARLILDQLGIPVKRYDAYEIDNVAISIAKYHYPDIIEHGDVRSLNLKDYKHYDLVCFGSPCQDFSSINSIRLGLKGAKSSLFYYGAACVQSGQFKHFLCENVRMSKDARAEISKTLGVPAVMVDSAIHSACHRPRNYWTDVVWTPSIDAMTADSKLEGTGWTAGCEKFGTLTCSPARPNQERLCSRLLSTWEAKILFRENPEGIYLHGTEVTTDHAVPGYLSRRFPLLEEGKRYELRIPTNVEYERFMELPDNYTAKGIDANGKVVDIGTWSRYRCVGNGWNVATARDILYAMFLG